MADNIATDETHNLIASDKVEGTSVYNANGDKLGSVHNLMVDKISGEVAYAVMSFGGCLGMGEKYHPLPWEVLDYDKNLKGYVVDLDKETLEKAPSYEAKEIPWTDVNYGQRVYDYYGVNKP